MTPDPCQHLRLSRIEIEAAYRKYFTEVRKFNPFPSEITFESVVDFVEWYDRQNPQAEVLRLRVALDEIASPIPFMHKRAEAEGGKLDGRMAVELSDDANFLKAIAREALRDLTPEPRAEEEERDGNLANG